MFSHPKIGKDRGGFAVALRFSCNSKGAFASYDGNFSIHLAVMRMWSRYSFRYWVFCHGRVG